MPEANTGPRFHELDEAEARSFLHARRLGRIAYSFHDRVDIAPINYAADGDWIYARTSEGAKLATLRHHPWCAFEVDEARGMFDWTSVVVKGKLDILGDGADDKVREHGVELLRELVPETFTAHDPTPRRSVLVRMHITEITGRRAQPASD